MANQEKQFHKIEGFVDLGSAKVGSKLQFVDGHGQWKQTSEVVYAQVSGTNVYVETKNSIYANYDIERNQNQTQSITAEQLLAMKCVEQGKGAQQLSDFNIDQLVMIDQNNVAWYIRPDQVEPGMHLQLEATVSDMETGRASHGILNIPNVKDFLYENGELIMESNSKMFSSIDFSQELSDIKRDLSIEHDMER